MFIFIECNHDVISINPIVDRDINIPSFKFVGFELK